MWINGGSYHLHNFLCRLIIPLAQELSVLMPDLEGRGSLLKDGSSGDFTPDASEVSSWYRRISDTVDMAYPLGNALVIRELVGTICVPQYAQKNSIRYFFHL